MRRCSLPRRPAGLALVIAGCGGSRGGYGVAGRLATKTSVSTAGPRSTGPSSMARAVRSWVPRSSCAGVWASIWPPVPAAAVPHGAARISTAGLGSIRRADGHSEATHARPPPFLRRRQRAPTDRRAGTHQFDGGSYVRPAPPRAERDLLPLATDRSRSRRARERPRRPRRCLRQREPRKRWVCMSSARVQWGSTEGGVGGRGP